MLSPRTLRSQLQQLATLGESLSAQLQVVATLTARATTDVSSLLGPVAMLDEFFARGMEQGLAWMIRDVDFPTLPLGLQRALLKHAALWSSLWRQAATLPVRGVAPRLTSGTTFVAGVAAGVRIEQIVNATALAGVDISAFWHTSSDAQVSLGRLISYDFALEVPIDNPLDHWTFVLANMAPRVPDVDILVAKFAALSSPSYADVVLNGQNAIRLVGGATLPSIAAQALGDASQWQVLATLNGLRPPYISGDPLDQLGAVQGNRALAQPIAAGSTQITLTDVTGLFADQRLNLRFGDTSVTVTIHAIDSSVHTVQVDAALPALPLATILTVYNPSYDVIGRVLQPGEYLVLPTAVGRQGQVSGLFLQRAAATQEAGLYGVDVATTKQGNLSVTNGDLTRAVGRVNLVQALQHRFETPRGSLTYHPLYGSDLSRLIGQRLIPYLSFFAAIDARQALFRDPRAAEVANVKVLARGDRMDIDAQVITVQQETFPVQASIPL